MSLFTELTPGTLLKILENEARELRQAKSEDEFVSVSVQMQKTLATYIADAMMDLRKSENLSIDDARHSTNRWLMTVLQDQENNRAEAA